MKGNTVEKNRIEYTIQTETFELKKEMSILGGEFHFL